MFKNEFWKAFASKNKYDTSEFPEDIQNNIKITLEERKNAYAPYSGFGVAAMIVTESGKTFLANNAETSNYDGTCAEAGAVAAYARAAKDEEILYIVVAGKAFENHSPKDDVFITPCGRCRQRIYEHCSADTPIISCSESGNRVLVASIDDLLPFAPMV
jgi:homotetrameric cytidine deaminase